MTLVRAAHLVPCLALLACQSSVSGDTGDADGSGGSTAGSTTDAAADSTGGTTSGTTGSSSGGDPTDEPTTGGTSGAAGPLHFQADVWPIVKANCSCHFPSMEMTPGQYTVLILDEDPSISYAKLIDQPSSVAGIDYVVPGDIEHSYVVMKLEGTHVAVGGLGDAMPPPPAMLAVADGAAIKAWIEQGALE